MKHNGATGGIYQPDHNHRHILSTGPAHGGQLPAPVAPCEASPPSPIGRLPRGQVGDDFEHQQAVRTLPLETDTRQPATHTSMPRARRHPLHLVPQLHELGVDGVADRSGSEDRDAHDGASAQRGMAPRHGDLKYRGQQGFTIRPRGKAPFPKGQRSWTASGPLSPLGARDRSTTPWRHLRGFSCTFASTSSEHGI